MSQPTLQDILNHAGGLLNSGRAAEAEALYRQILAVHPRQVDALYGLGAIAMGQGKMDLAINYFSQIVNLTPENAGALSNYGSALLRGGRVDDAIEVFDRALALAPQMAEAHSNLGQAFYQKGMKLEAIAALRRAIAIKPDFAMALHSLGALLTEVRQHEEAIAVLRRAEKLAPNYPPINNTIGYSLRESGRLEEALPDLKKAIDIWPAYAAAFGNLGNVLRELGRIDEAMSAYQQAVNLRPDIASFHANLAHAQMEKLDDAGAQRSYEKSLELEPDNADAHFGLGLLLLRRGEFERGWRECEWRWNMSQTTHHRLALPLWTGEPLTGKTLFLHTEQGFGDTIQFFRYVRMIAGAGGKIALRCQAELQRLIGRALAEFPDCQLIGPKELAAQADFQCPLMSLPLVMKTTLENIPRTVPYLHADPGHVDFFRGLLAQTSRRLNVGLAWAGRPTHPNDRNRSIPPEKLSPLLQTPGVRFVSLQKFQRDAGAMQLPLLDLTAELSDFAETAALVMNLDLVITVDTAVAHLAGALGKPVWVLLPHAPDWRWMLSRSDSPWYPTMRLFRQSKHGDWSGPVADATAALSAFNSGQT